MQKKYSPYRIINPSEGHVVPLMPNQDFILNVTDKNAEIDFHNEFFFLKQKEVLEDSISFHFSQKFDLDNWSLFSKVFLGEVLVCYSNALGSLSVYLDNSENLLTIINPNSASIKVNPNSIIEVVVYDPNDYRWESAFISSTFGKVYEQVGYKKIVINEIDILSEYPLLHRGALLNHYGPEHHFWFKYNFTDLPHGCYHVGKIIISSQNEQEIRMLNVSVNSKNRKCKLFSKPNKSFIAPRKNFAILKKDISFEKRVGSDLDEHCEAYIMNFGD